MVRARVDKRFQEFRVHDGVESPFSDEQKQEIQEALEACHAGDKYQDTVIYLDIWASHFMPWGNLDQFPKAIDRHKGLTKVAEMATKLAQAIWGDQSIIGADAERVHRLMLQMKRMPAHKLHRELTGLAAVCTTIAKTPDTEPEPGSSMEQLADRLAAYFVHGLRVPPTSYRSEDHDKASPYMRILMVCATAYSKRHISWEQLKRPASSAVRRAKQQSVL